MKNDLPYTRIAELNPIVTELMNDWNCLVEKAKRYGMDIRFAPNCTETLELYFHDDYPDMLLVDKDISCRLGNEVDRLSCFGKYYDEDGLACTAGSHGLCSDCVECQKADPNY